MEVFLYIVGVTFGVFLLGIGLLIFLEWRQDRLDLEIAEKARKAARRKNALYAAPYGKRTEAPSLPAALAGSKLAVEKPFKAKPKQRTAEPVRYAREDDADDYIVQDALQMNVMATYAVAMSEPAYSAPEPTRYEPEPSRYEPEPSRYESSYSSSSSSDHSSSDSSSSSSSYD